MRNWQHCFNRNKYLSESKWIENCMKRIYNWRKWSLNSNRKLRTVEGSAFLQILERKRGEIMGTRSRLRVIIVSIAMIFNGKWISGRFCLIMKRRKCMKSKALKLPTFWQVLWWIKLKTKVLTDQVISLLNSLMILKARLLCKACQVWVISTKTNKWKMMKSP